MPVSFWAPTPDTVLCAPLKDCYPGMPGCRIGQWTEQCVDPFQLTSLHIVYSPLGVPSVPTADPQLAGCPRHPSSGKLSLTSSPQGQSVAFIIIILCFMVF